MTEERRGKRRKQSNPRRNRVNTEQVSSLGSEEEDEGGLWSLEPQDCLESLEKTSLTPSEGTEEPGSPAPSTQQHNLSTGTTTCWTQVEPETKAEQDIIYISNNSEGDQEPLRMYCDNSDSQNAFENLAHYNFVVQLRKACPSVSSLEHLNHNGEAAAYHLSSRQEELPPAIWSPGAQHCSPEETGRSLQACPFCHRTYQRGAPLRDHVKFCQEREGIACPFCGYIATHRSQMEQHLELHNQIQDKSVIALDQGIETRKFKCLQCGKAFKYKHHLKEHLRIHSGEKPYECSNCKKRFSHSGSYSSHLSSKKCLSGGGHAGGNSGTFNGHGQSSYLHSLPTSPLAGGGRNSNQKSTLAFSNQDGVRPTERVPGDVHPLASQELSPNIGSSHGASDLSRLWDPLRTRTTLLPHFDSGSKFEQMLQEMLHKDGRKDPEADRDNEERRFVHNGEGAEKKFSPPGEADRSAFGVTCRWCLQVFPNLAVLLQHERYLCKINREAVELPEAFPNKDSSSPNLVFTRTSHQSESSKASEVTNGLSGNKSPSQKPSWHSVPQQLLVAMQSPSSHQFWSNQEKGSPSRMIRQSAEISSPRGRKRVYSPGFSPPASCPELPSPHREPGSQWSSQNEPLDLSLPKQQRIRNRTPNGIVGRVEKRILRAQPLCGPNPSSPLSLHQHPVFSGAGPPVFPASLYNGFPIFNQSGFTVHDAMSPSSFGQAANSSGFLSPVGYVMEAEAEAALKKYYRERQGLMGEMLNRSSFDYLTLIDDAFDVDGGPGRKRLRKTDEGLYACDICEKTFQKSSSLLRHKYEHTGKRPHECKICNKAFKHKHHLIEHSRLHSGEKPYQCDKCGKRFSHSGSYSQHMNHRYAYCSKDQDPEQDQEEAPPANTPLSLDDTPTAHSFLSDSSLDGAPDAIKEDEEERATGGAEETGSSPINEPAVVDDQTEKNIYETGNLVNNAEKKLWDRNTENQNGDLDQCELSLDMKELPRIKT